MHRLTSLGTILLVALAGCASSTEPVNLDDTYPSGVYFGSQSDAMFADATIPPTFRVRPTRVVVLGVARAPSDCYTVPSGEVTQTGAEVTLTITVTSHGAPACFAVVVKAPYRASIDLPPGAYTVRVRHRVLPELDVYALAVDTTVVIQ